MVCINDVVWVYAVGNRYLKPIMYRLESGKFKYSKAMLDCCSCCAWVVLDTATEVDSLYSGKDQYGLSEASVWLCIVVKN